MNNIGNVIAKMRKNNELTQEELATKIGVSAQTVSKWERGTTMPDILLLPVIADVFNVTVDYLFGREYIEMVKPVKHSEFSEQMHKEFLFDLYRGFLDKEISADEVWKKIDNMTEYWDENPDSQILMIPKSNFPGEKMRYCGGYGNKDLGIVWRKSYKESTEILKDAGISDILRAFANDDFRRIMIYQLENPNEMFTEESVTAKCNMDTENAKSALEKLVKYNFTNRWEVDMGEERKAVYQATHTHKMILVFVMAEIATRLINYKEMYTGFNN